MPSFAISVVPLFNMVIGVTGNTGAGKTTVCKIFKEHGAKVISADEIGWQVIKKGTREYEQILKDFGTTILNNEGEIDRRRLGTIVFSQPEKRAVLNRIVHPRLVANLKEEIRKTKEGELLVIDAALIFDWGLEKELDLVIVVTAPKRIKIERLKKTGLTENEARMRLNSQQDEATLTKKADVVIKNSNSYEELRRECESILKTRLY